MPDQVPDHVIVSNKRDVRAAEAVRGHHAKMSDALALQAEALAAAARAGRRAEADLARDDLVRWCRAELVPHALAEESTMYAVAGQLAPARLLIEAMLAEHRALTGLVDELAAATDPVSAATLARALQALFEVHLAKEEEQVLPLLVAAPTISVAGLLGGMHELIGAAAPDAVPTAAAPGGSAAVDHGCGCREVDPAGYPELDARAIPHAIRHATIFGALGGLRPGAGLVLVAPHDPVPLLAQLERREPGGFDVELPRARARGLAAGAGTAVATGSVRRRHLATWVTCVTEGRGTAVGEQAVTGRSRARRGERRSGRRC